MNFERFFLFKIKYSLTTVAVYFFINSIFLNFANAGDKVAKNIKNSNFQTSTIFDLIVKDVETETLKFFKLKISKMKNNYAFDSDSENQLTFKSYSIDDCNISSKTDEKKIDQNTSTESYVAAKIQFQNAKSDNLVINSTFYYGCDNRFLFLEKKIFKVSPAINYINENKSLESVSNSERFESIYKSNSDPFDQFQYEIVDYQGQSLIKVNYSKSILNEKIARTFDYFVQNKKIFELSEISLIGRNITRLKVFPFSYGFQFYDSQFGFGSSSSGTLTVDESKEGLKYYYSFSNYPISKKEFDQFYNSYFINMIFSMGIGQFMRPSKGTNLSILDYFPKIDQVGESQVRSKLSKQLEEIRFNVLNGANKADILKTLEQILKDSENGSIQDNR